MWWSFLLRDGELSLCGGKLSICGGELSLCVQKICSTLLNLCSTEHLRTSDICWNWLCVQIIFVPQINRRWRAVNVLTVHASCRRAWWWINLTCQRRNMGMLAKIRMTKPALETSRVKITSRWLPNQMSKHFIKNRKSLRLLGSSMSTNKIKGKTKLFFFGHELRTNNVFKRSTMFVFHTCGVVNLNKHALSTHTKCWWWLADAVVQQKGAAKLGVV